MSFDPFLWIIIGLINYVIIGWNFLATCLNTRPGGGLIDSLFKRN